MNERSRFFPLVLPLMAVLALTSGAFISGYTGAPLASNRPLGAPTGKANKGQTPSIGTQMEPYTHVWNDVFDTALQSPPGELAEKVPFCEMAKYVPGGDESWKLIICLVNGKDFPEDQDERRRLRYAVHAGLNAVQIRAKDPEHIRFVTWDAPASKQKGEGRRLRVPFEWFTTRERVRAPSSTLCVYVNEDELGDHPVSALTSLHDEIRNGMAGVEGTRLSCEDVSVLGPTTSALLKEILSEATFKEPSEQVTIRHGGDSVCGRHIRFFCSNASVPLRMLVNELPAGIRAQFEDAANNDSLAFEFPTAQGKVLIERPGTDRGLTKKLADELGLRDVLPREDSSVVLLAEQDTRYGAGLVEGFENAVEEKTGSRVGITTYWFPRGLDGYTPALVSPDKAAASPSSNLPLPDFRAQVGQTSKAIGDAQADYLERLRTELLRVQEEKGVRVKAIGLFCFDVFDKVVLLRALRDAFPTTWFFTTELDAQLTTRDEYRYTHNLIVASHFGLRLSPISDGGPSGDGALDDFQPDNFPLPFRAQQQMAAYFGVRHLVTGAPVWKAEPPRAYEIGLSGHVRMDANHPSAAPTWIWKLLLLAVLIPTLIPFTKLVDACLDWVAGWAVRKAPVAESNPAEAEKARLLPQVYEVFKNWWFVCAALALGFVALATILTVSHFVSQCDSEEPFYWHEGVSIWPSTILNVFTGALSLVLFAHMVFRQQCATRELKKVCKDLGGGKKYPEDRTLVERLTGWWADTWTGHYSQWRLWTLPWMVLPQRDTAKKAWEDYKVAIDGGVTILKCSLASLAICAMYHWCFSKHFAPARGECSRLAEHCGFLFGLLSYSFLLAGVVYNVTICRAFARNLVNFDSNWHKELRVRGVPEDSAELRDAHNNLIDLEIIGKVTEGLQSWAYYPYFPLLIIIASRIFIFDQWDWSLPRLGFYILAFMSTLCSEWYLSGRCDEMRQRQLADVKSKEFRADASIKGKMQEVLQRIETLNVGAFRPFSESPMAKMLVVPAGGIGGVALLQYFSYLHW